MYGVERLTAIIHPPQAAVLGCGAAVQKPVVIDGAIVIRTMMEVTLSVDHRLADGVTAAKFLQVFRTHIESPQALCHAAADIVASS